MVDPVQVQGLREFTRSLKKLDADLPKALRVGMNEAVDLIVGYAKPKIPKRTGAAASTLKAKSTQTAARISAGGRKAPYYPWLDFGGKGPNNRPAQREFHREGRYVWKGLVVKRDEFNAALGRALVDVAQRAGIEVT